MNKEQSWVLPLGIYLSSIALTAFSLNFLNGSLNFKAFFEIFFCLTLLALLFAHQKIQHFILQLPRPHLVVLTAMVFCLYVGHLTPAPRLTFPFVPWKMFDQPIKGPVIDYFEYWGKDKKGNRVQIIPTEVFPSLANGRLGTALRERLRDILRTAKPRPPQKRLFASEFETSLDLAGKKKRFHEILISMGRIYNRQHAGASIDSIVVFRCSRDASQRNAPAQCKGVWETTLK